MTSRLTLTALAALFLAGCAATPYQPNGLRGGYSEVRLGTDTFAVTFNGNGYASEVQTRSMAFLRGAELCRDAGYAWMAALKDNSKVNRDVRVTPARTRVSTYAQTNKNGRYTGSSGNVTRTPERPRVTERPVAQLEIRCLRGNPKKDRRILHVERYIRTVGTQFGVALAEQDGISRMGGESGPGDTGSPPDST